MKSSNREMEVAVALSITLVTGLSLSSYAQEPDNSHSNAPKHTSGTHYALPATPIA